MYSSEDLERFYFQYQTEALPHGESSLQLFDGFCKCLLSCYHYFCNWKNEPKNFLRPGKNRFCFSANVNMKNIVI